MKKISTILFTALSLVALFSECILAHDGTIYITGVIHKKTCSISPDSQTLTVTMDNVQSTYFTRPGMGADYHPFTLSVENCAGTEGSVSITFDGTPDTVNPDLLTLIGGEGYATGIGVGIYNQDKTLIAIGSHSQETLIIPNQSDATLHFYARYVATASTVTTGTANATTTFILNYA
ncbi:fimbrial protein [Enterobacter oligotrophicus]|uniref:fimbrial protein n=1 Tax=Enterobacter oligotrophicus TaxID=2478464 RepID=UPI0023F52DC4|nr:fimbrial protein [Enterobacter oligotrophicus]